MARGSLKDRSDLSNPPESSFLHFVGHPVDYENVTDRRATNAVLAQFHHGARISCGWLVTHNAEGSPQRVTVVGHLHVDGGRAFVFLLSVGPSQVGPLLKNIVSGVVWRVLPMVNFNDHRLDERLWWNLAVRIAAVGRIGVGGP